MSSANPLHSRNRLTTFGSATVGVIAATCLGVVAASDTLSAVNPFYFDHARDREISYAPASADAIPSTQIALDSAAPPSQYTDALIPPLPNAKPPPSVLSPGLDRPTLPTRAANDNIDQEQSLEAGQALSSTASDNAPTADAADQPMEGDVAADQEIAESPSDPSD
jgi:hypothetical protein